MAKHLVNVFKSGKKIYVKGDGLLIIIPFDTEDFLQIYNGDKVSVEIDVSITPASSRD